MLPSSKFNEECKEHKEKLNIFCIQESRFICVDCLPNHQGHYLLSKKQIIDFYSS